MSYRVLKVTTGKRFCCRAHRAKFWSALRRWGERAVAAGMLSLDQIRNASAEACTLLPGGDAPARIARASETRPCGDSGALWRVRGAARRAAGCYLPGNGWFEVTDRLPGELVERLCARIEAGCVGKFSELSPV